VPWDTYTLNLQQQTDAATATGNRAAPQVLLTTIGAERPHLQEWITRGY
jgi:hypothetical protein